MLAIIGSSGLPKLPELMITHREIVRTPYGDPSGPVVFGHIGGRELIFLARHGFSERQAPHEINYQANIFALKIVGAQKILALSAVTSLKKHIDVGTLVMPHDLIDYTYKREHTYFSGKEIRVQHAHFYVPYDAELRKEVASWADNAGVLVSDRAVYSCLQGPRLPTCAEVRRYINDGGDVFGMTAMPEAILAFEQEMAYTHLCGVMNQITTESEDAYMPSYSSVNERVKQQIQAVLRQID